VHYIPQKDPSVEFMDVKLSDVPSNPAVSQILEMARRFGPKLQLNSPGYLPNKRQQAACGFAVLELAQRLKALWRQDDTMVSGMASSGDRNAHEFGWRDLYDILVRWRQYSEPNDPVWWVDLLSPEQFEDGFGSHTPMITGQTNVIRYYPMFKRSFAIMKTLIPLQCNLPSDVLAAIDAAGNCKDLYELMGRDFYVVTPCHSIAKLGKIMEGTRLTLQYADPEGFEYSIRTPGTPPRWVDYDKELKFVFSALSEEARRPEPNIDKVSDWILIMTFYWYNFMPLSRGTAAVGYMGLLGMFLALDIEITSFVPKDIQVDWEGILTPKPEEFISFISTWLYPSRQRLSIDHLPSVNKTFPTVRSMVQALNVAVCNF